MTKFEISDAMLDAAEQAYDTIAAIEHDAWCYTAPTRAAITAAIEASGLVEENARLRDIIRVAKANIFNVQIGLESGTTKHAANEQLAKVRATLGAFEHD